MDPNLLTEYNIEKAEPPPSQKYIRTYASDVAIVQRGGTPELTPFPEISTPPTQQDEPLLREQINLMDERISTIPVFTVPPPPPPPEPTPLPVEAPLPPGEVPEPTSFHTYSGDFSEHVLRTGASATTILAAEQDAGHADAVPVPATFASGNRLKIVGGAALLLVSGIGAYAAYTSYVAHTGPVTLVPTVFSPIFVDERETVSSIGASLLLALSQAVGRPLPSGQMRLVYYPNATTSTPSIFNELALPAPAILLRNINAANSMAGVVNIAGVQSPFFILSVTSYGDTFAGMLTWETHLLRDLSLLFPPYPAVPVTSQEIATDSTSSPQATADVVVSPAPDQGFIDKVVANHDARVYRDGAGRSILIYGYWNQRTLVIARDEATFTAILGRLGTSRTR